MKRTLVAASLATLALFGGQALAAPVMKAGAAGSMDGLLQLAQGVEVPADLQGFVSQPVNVGELKTPDLAARIRKLASIVQDKTLPRDFRQQARAKIQESRFEMQKRRAARNAKKVADGGQPKAEGEIQAPIAGAPAAQTAEVPAIVNEAVNLSTITTQALGAHIRKLGAIVRDKNLSADVRAQARAKWKEARQEMQSRRAAGNKKLEAGGKKPASNGTPAVETGGSDQNAAPEVAPQPKEGASSNVPEKAAATQLDGNSGDSSAEAHARKYFDTASGTASLGDRELRRRLNEMRMLLSGNKLSGETEKELRGLLRKERDVLRGRLEANKPKDENAGGNTNNQNGGGVQAPQPKGEPKITRRTPRDEVLKDRRRPDDLRDDELRIRIRVFLDFQSTDRYRSYNEAQRREWNEQVRRDREFLRRRLDERRNLRRAQLDRPSNINIVIRDDDRYEGPDDVFAAEVQDDDIERVLVAPPRRPVARKVTVQEYEQDPQARRAMSRIEVDTIRFGFNEAFVREEEVDNLDRIAWVIERVLAKYPNETFLIEGHTDAVGDNAYNQKLSRARAEAVKKALTTYYVIPGRNLRTVGMGERFLKIPTAEAEQENRRVSISRATNVISGYAD